MHPTDAAPPLALDDYAPRSISTCTVCGLPPKLIRELQAARQRDPQRFTYPVIAAWLDGVHKLEVSDSSLRRHFKRGHASRIEAAK